MSDVDGEGHEEDKKNMPFHFDHLLQTIRDPEIAALV